MFSLKTALAALMIIAAVGVSDVQAGWRRRCRCAGLGGGWGGGIGCAPVADCCGGGGYVGGFSGGACCGSGYGGGYYGGMAYGGGGSWY